LDALNTIDRANRIVTASNFCHHPGYLRVDQEWVLMNKAEALLASGSPGSAIEALEPIYDGDPSARQRYLYTAILEAEAYIVTGEVIRYYRRKKNTSARKYMPPPI